MHALSSKHLLALGLFSALSLSLFAENIRPMPVKTGCSPCVCAVSESDNSLKINLFNIPAAAPNSNDDGSGDPIEFATNAALWLAPNPAVSYLTVGLRFDAETTATIEILDLVGRSLQRETQCLREGNITFSVADLPKGVFLVRVTAGGQVKWTRRFHKV